MKCNLKKRSLSVLLIMALVLSLTLSGCGSKESVSKANLISTDESIESITASEDATPSDDEVEIVSQNISDSSESEMVTDISFNGTEGVLISDFSMRLFNQSLKEDANTLISPISVLYALAMTANGAREETLDQMENLFGLSVEELNVFLSAYIRNLPTDEKYKLSIANSIWIRDIDTLTIEQEFLQTNSKYYNADIYTAPFDQSTIKDINGWVSEHTDEMIPKIIENISDDTIMFLVNALTFDAKWQTEYEDYQVNDGIFTKEDGTTKDIELMYSTEQEYLEDEGATGFIKYYKGKKYAFVALLPKEGTTVSDYVSTLTGEHLQDMLKQPQDFQVEAAIPKFETEYSIEMSEVLKDMGVTDAFDWKRSDLSGIGSSTEGNLAISSILHKTYISVDTEGTKAAAATVVAVDTCAAMPPEEFKTVYLDRPFVYLLIDCENHLPLFIGTVMDVNN